MDYKDFLRKIGVKILAPLSHSASAPSKYGTLSRVIDL